MKAFQVMSTPVWTVTPASSLKEAARLLIEHDVSALPVVNGEDQLVGIVSEADLLELAAQPDPRTQATALASPHLAGKRVRDVMTRDVIWFPHDADVAYIAQQMLAAHVKRVPILHGRRLVGIVSRRDLVKVIARDDHAIRREVEDLLARQEYIQPKSVAVEEGVVTLDGGADRAWRLLAEILVRTVPGVLEVRFRPA